MTARATITAMTFAVALIGLSSISYADTQNAECSFLEIKASNDDSGIDSKLKPLTKKLKKPPLSSWKSFKLVAKHDKSLAQMKAEEVKLQLGRKLSALLRERTQGAKARFEVSLTIDNKQGKRAVDSTVKVSAGNYIILAFDATAESGNLLAFTCK